ncbi:MAG: GDP-L-fucose synthase [Gammaproteobacteria bacterium]|nr:GDP-L-fucose synthase [Gammaproteobacteria bacterium]MBV9621600.1 GDP-L-fucose synthase [Gammaproteobacteria bacterium]
MKQPGPIFVAGHRGLVGAALVRRLRAAGHEQLLLREHRELDLTSQQAVRDFFERERPQQVYLAAAQVGGILANSTYPADFLRNNLLIQTNVIDSAWRAGVRKLLFLGSSCIYPREAPQPLREEALLTGPLESTNEAYAVAKIAGIKMCQAYRRQHGFNAISLMPTNLYGPGDNFSLQGSHVLPALLRRIHEAKETQAEEVLIWGSGRPRREFLHVDDLADACLFLMARYEDERLLNVGWGRDVTIAELAALVARVVGFSGTLRYDPSKPDGTPQKLLDISRLAALGWVPSIDLEAGIRSTYSWFLAHRATLRT